MSEWERRLDDLARRGWRNRVQCLGEPTIEYVGLTHRGDLASDRVVVRVEARMRDFVEDLYGNHIRRAGRLAETVFTKEFWTLARNASGNWILASVEQGAEGKHAIADQIVATAWSDEQSMHDEALVEGAVAQAVPEGTKVAEVAALEFDGDARAAALDLSLADGRFSPDVLEVAARRAVKAWAEAVDGGDASLRAIATPDAARELLHPGDPSGRTRLVVRGPRGQADPGRRARSGGGAADDDDRGRRRGLPLPGGPGHHRGDRRQQVARCSLHRAVDVRARRRSRATVAHRLGRAPLATS